VTTAVGRGATGEAFDIAKVTTEAIAAIETAYTTRFTTLSLKAKSKLPS
jgi:hypothetical protein